MPKHKQYKVQVFKSNKDQTYFIYDTLNKWLVPGFSTKNKRQARGTANMWNTKRR